MIFTEYSLYDVLRNTSKIISRYGFQQKYFFELLGGQRGDLGERKNLAKECWEFVVDVMR